MSDFVMEEYKKVSDKLLKAEKKLLIYETLCGEMIKDIVERTYEENEEEMRKCKGEDVNDD